MVIQCSSCNTRFKLADDKMKPGGVKVRCSKCKEVFTVMPPEEEAAPAPAPEEEQPAPTDGGGAEESSGADWSDMADDTSSAEEESSDELSFGIDEDSFGDLPSDTEAETGGSSTESFTFGAAPDEQGDDNLSFDENSTESGTDELSFDSPAEEESSELSFDEPTDEAAGGISFDDATEASASDDEFGFDEPVGEGTQDEISFDDTPANGSDVSEDDFGFDEPVGEGAQDEFSFDDSPAEESTDEGLDFDWDGSDAGGAPDDFDFEEGGEEGGEGGLDFSSISLEGQEEETGTPEPMMETPPAVETPEEKPVSAKGPNKGKGSKKGRKKKKAKGKSPLRGLLVFILLILLLICGHGGLLIWKGYWEWQGDPMEMINLDVETVHLQVYKDLIAEVTGGEVAGPAVGNITVVNMNGRFIENGTSGTLFVIEGQVKNDFKEARSAIAVRGILYSQDGKPVMRKKVYCGNKLSDSELKSLPLAEINSRLDNQFGDSLSNLDVAAGASLPYSIVFSKLPADLAEFNVEVAESTPGAK